MNAIEVNGISKQYKDFLLDNVSFTLPKGTILGLVGENGAGKSTTIKLIMNAIARDSGLIRVLGEDNTSPAFHGVEALVKKAMLPHGTQTEFTTLENIILFLAKRGERA